MDYLIICDVKNKCCYYDDGVSSSCSRSGDVNYYSEKYGFEQMNNLRNDDYPDLLNWTSCIETLPE